MKTLSFAPTMSPDHGPDTTNSVPDGADMPDHTLTTLILTEMAELTKSALITSEDIGTEWPTVTPLSPVPYTTPTSLDGAEVLHSGPDSPTSTVTTRSRWSVMISTETI